jgi:hypothetical protein
VTTLSHRILLGNVSDPDEQNVYQTQVRNYARTRWQCTAADNVASTQNTSSAAPLDQCSAISPLVAAEPLEMIWIWPVAENGIILGVWWHCVPPEIYFYYMVTCRHALHKVGSIQQVALVTPFENLKTHSPSDHHCWECRDVLALSVTYLLSAERSTSHVRRARSHIARAPTSRSRELPTREGTLTVHLVCVLGAMP